MKTITLTDNEAAILRLVMQWHVDTTAEEDTMALLEEALPLRLESSDSEVFTIRTEAWADLCGKIDATSYDGT